MSIFNTQTLTAETLTLFVVQADEKSKWKEK